MNLYDIAIAKKLSGGGGGGGGASNIVQGEFKTEGNWIQTVEIPYTGNGHPVAALIWVKGGLYDASSGTANISRLNGNNSIIWGMVKGNTNIPSWSSSDDDKASVFVLYKYGDADTQIARVANYSLFKTGDPSTGSSTDIVSWVENNKIKLCQTTGSGRQFLRGLDYEYVVVYSS